MTIKLGRRAEITRTYSFADKALFADLAGLGEAWLDSVPEPLVGALFSYLLGVELPGFGTNYLKQEMRFLMPAPYDTPLTASVTVTRLRPEKHLVDLETVCVGADGSRICEGRALVYVEDVGA
ncbi:phosphate acetyltransferase [Microbaculum marinum]|uniref:Phosphate acetyltransferase n=1 Tax=Microbaculum marinum TaxID=1764581 RepID=A0AAW9S3W2_9HYPH